MNTALLHILRLFESMRRESFFKARVNDETHEARLVRCGLTLRYPV